MNAHLVAAAVHLLPALLWAVIAWHLWRLRRDLKMEGTAFRVGAVLPRDAAS